MNRIGTIKKKAFDYSWHVGNRISIWITVYLFELH